MKISRVHEKLIVSKGHLARVFCLFAMSSIHRGFTLDEICGSTDLKESTVRHHALSKFMRWGYLEKKVKDSIIRYYLKETIE